MIGYQWNFHLTRGVKYECAGCGDESYDIDEETNYCPICLRYGPEEEEDDG